MNAGKTPPKLSKYSFLLVVALSVLVLAFATKSPLVPEEKKISYTEFQTYASKPGSFKKLALINQQDKISGVIENGTKEGMPFYVNVPKGSVTLDKTLSDLAKKGVAVNIENPGLKEGFSSMFMMIIVPALLFIGLWFLIMRQAHVGGNQAMSFGRSRAKLLTENLTPVTFADVAGVDEAKQELEEIIEFLKDPKRFQMLGAKIPKGVLLVGPPGSGKTLLARAIAGEAKVPFFHMSGSDFVEMFVGVGASRVRDLFDQAKKNSPCLVFIDEIDAVGRQRGAGLGGGHDEREQTLNQLLVEMDGFAPNAGVILIAATNRPDVLDPALLRPGRFDRRVVVDRPDVKGRLAILEVHSRGKQVDPAVDLEVVARRTPGFTGADLANIMNEAAILAARKNVSLVVMEHIDEAIERNIAGPERKSRLLSETAKKITAYHEAGHALVARLTPDTDPVHKISILPRGFALGYTLQIPLEDKYITAKTELINDIKVLLGGRVAEELIFGQDSITTGASNDLERVKTIARKMVCEFGMSEKLGPLTFGHKHEAVFLGRDLAEERDYSEQVASVIDTEIRAIVDGCYEETAALLKTHINRLKLVAEKLMENETLDGVLLENLLDGKDLPEDELTRLKGERRAKNEQEGADRRQKKDDEAAARIAAAANGEPAAENATPAATAQPSAAPAAAAAAATTTAAPQLPSSGALAKFTTALDDILSSLYRPRMRASLPQGSFKLADDLFFTKHDFSKSLEYIRLSLNECRDRELIPGLRIMLGLAYLKLGLVDRVSDELMAALMAAPDKLEQNVERALVKSISYFRIVNEELKKSGLTLQTLLDDSSAVETIETRYKEWEQRTGLQPGPQSPAI